MNILQDDLTLLTKPDHFLGWLGEDPAAVIRDQLEEVFKQQIPTAWLGQLIVTAPPRFLTGARRYQDSDDDIPQINIKANPHSPALADTGSPKGRDTANTTQGEFKTATDAETESETETEAETESEDSYTFVLVRAALAMPFKAIVCQPGGIVHEINGVLTWIATGLDTEDSRKDNLYLDLDDAADSAMDLLEERLYEDEDQDEADKEQDSELADQEKDGTIENLAQDIE
ncbi:MAG: hypothetical protein J0M35_01960 [Candidatus Obscuribacter phosphatis]|uniref:Uncharacterized protein n=1 Tax=Candidatus Obscuribacter phosphatis TaxID=1906157 RepID=A0A8J7TLJ7_9BACT|nr:hypothetical protein [Candidatus Obscuribacter phosphatis]